MKAMKKFMLLAAMIGGLSSSAYDCQFDVSGAPELAGWTETKLKPLVETWYPKLCEMLASKDFQAPEKVRFRFLDNEKMHGTPAWTAGNEISLNRQWFGRNLEGEALGCTIHEMVHVVQSYHGRVPGWVQEGLADYVRWFLFEPEKHAARADFRNPRTRYDNSYRVSANFIDWVERRHGNPKNPIFRRLNATCRNRRYTDDFWKQATGKDLQALDAEWKSSSRPVFVVSPDRRNAIVLSLSRRGVEMSVRRDRKTQATVVFECQRYVEADDAPDGRTCVIEKVSRRRVTGQVAAPVYKKAKVNLEANETTVRFADGWGFVLHARNDGVAYRLFTEKEGRRRIAAENIYIDYPSKDTRCWAGANNGSWRGDRMQNSWETVFTPTTIGELRPYNARLYYLPLVTSHDGVFTAFTESDLRDYPGANLVRFENESDIVRLWHAQLPAEERVEGPHVRVPKHLPYFADTEVRRVYPWGVFMLGDNPADLAAADIVWALAAPQEASTDFSWVKPGVTSWNWWSSSPCSTESILSFIDFSADYGLPYVLVDASWETQCDIHRIRPTFDMKRVMAHAAEKKVEVILWVGWSQLKGKAEAEVAYLAGLGAKGLKIDFMDRDDQVAVRSIEEIAAACAKHHLVIDWHGMFKPTGLERKYPNILNYEGIFGLETMRWDPFDDMPRHDCQAAFTRMLAGPMDYTPGGMRNLTRAAYKPTRARDQVPTQGTRVHQMALMALFFAPLQMMADSVAAYRANPECAKFMAATPAVWDDTVALPSEMGKTACLARRKGDAWYLVAIGDWSARTLELSTKFLGSGEWNADAFEDAADADKEPTHWNRRRFKVKAGEPVKAKLAPGGGFIVRLTPVK